SLDERKLAVILNGPHRHRRGNTTTLHLADKALCVLPLHTVEVLAYLRQRSTSVNRKAEWIRVAVEVRLHLERQSKTLPLYEGQRPAVECTENLLLNVEVRPLGHFLGALFCKCEAEQFLRTNALRQQRLDAPDDDFGLAGAVRSHSHGVTVAEVYYGPLISVEADGLLLAHGTPDVLEMNQGWGFRQDRS